MSRQQRHTGSRAILDPPPRRKPLPDPSLTAQELSRTMKSTHSVSAICTLILLTAAAPAFAQYKPRPVNDPATGESYHIEATAGLWFPNIDMAVTSSGTGSLSGLSGTTIGAQTDLGMPDSKTLPVLSLTLRPARSHKFRFSYVPITFDGSATIKRNLDFNGQRY